MFRNASIISLAIISASLISFTLSNAPYYWLLLTTYFILQMPRGLQIRQAFQVISILIMSVLITPFIAIYPMIYSAILICVFIVAIYLYYINQTIAAFSKQLILLVPFSLLLASLSPFNTVDVIKFTCLNILIGGLLGIVFNKLYFKFDAASIFKSEIIPLIECLAKCTEMLANDFVENKMFPINPASSIMNVLIANQCTHSPEWIYSPGFNPGLRSGMRFFIIHLERISEILYSLDGLVKSSAAEQQWRPLALLLSNALQRNKDLLRTLIVYFQNQTPVHMSENYTSDMVELENHLHQVLPKELALMDIDPSHLVLAAVVREVKDMRSILLQLALITQKAIQPAL